MSPNLKISAHHRGRRSSIAEFVIEHHNNSPRDDETQEAREKAVVMPQLVKRQSIVSPYHLYVVEIWVCSSLISGLRGLSG